MSKVIKSYNQLPPNVKQAVNNMAMKAAKSVVTNVQTQMNKKKASQNRGRTTRTRNGMRIYAPNDVVETKSIAPVSYATTWTSGNKSLRIHQTEVIGRVSANDTWFPSWNANYSVATFPINPANPKTFPWLSYIARLYDKYRFHGLRFIYVNSVSTVTEGNIMMCLDYDTLDDAPSNLVQASQLAKYKLSPMYCPADFSVPVTHPGNNPWLYTFDLAATSGNVDLKTYNLGNFFFALDGVPQDGKDYGYLAVEYDVELLDKNPVADVFASKTFDSGAPVSKANRSNVDPADTMEVESTWTAASLVTTNTLKLVFSDDVAPGTKARVGAFLKHSFLPDSSGASIGFSTSTDPVATTGTTVLEYLNDTSHANSTNAYNRSCYINLDVVVPVDRTVEVVLTSNSTCKYSSSVTPSCSVVAYTYA